MLSMALARNWARKLGGARGRLGLRRVARSSTRASQEGCFLDGAACRESRRRARGQGGSMLVRFVLSLYHAGGFAGSLAVGTEDVLDVN